MAKKTIILERDVEENNVLPLAIKRGYKPTIINKTETKIKVVDALNQKLEIKEYIDVDNCIAIIEEEVPNEDETAIEFLAKKAQKELDDGFERDLFAIHMEEKNKTREEEEKQIKEKIKKQVGTTKIQIK